VIILQPFSFGSIHKDVFDNLHEPAGLTTKGDVVIGNDVWIGDNVTIMSGVTVGDGAIIAAYSHIVKDVEPYSVVGGNPGKFIRYRFRKDQIEKLLQIKWWDWEEKDKQVS
jgi:acetyltransferase-like isoleucine patch superfamily enzyme